MFVSFNVDMSVGSVFFHSSQTDNCSSIKSFFDDLDIQNYKTIRISSDVVIEEHKSLYLPLAKYLWGKLSEMPIFDDGADGLLALPFYHFPFGTPIYDVWHWFEVEFDVSVAKDLMGLTQ